MINLTGNHYPWKDGSFLGDIVPETTLELMVINKKIDDLMNFVEEEFSHDQHELTVEIAKNEMSHLHQEELDLLLNEQRSIYDKIDICKNIFLKCTSVPLTGRIKIIQGQEPYLENFYKLQINAREDVTVVVNKVIKDLVKGMPVDYNLSSSNNIVTHLTNKITTLLKSHSPLEDKETSQESEDTSLCSTEVEFYASCISLNRTQVYKNLAVRRSGLSPEMIENASKLYVISEYLLGGLFFGMRTYTKDQDGTINFSLNMSVELKGTMSGVVWNNLDATYHNWKNDLLSNSKTGYPLAYKVKNLKDLLA